MADANRAEINRLYWETDRSVGDIAASLGVSRRSLYDSINHLPVDEACPDCGGAMGFRNRTARDAREAECPDCGSSMELDHAPAPDYQDEPEVEQESAGGRLSPLPARRVPGPRSAPLLGSTLLAGLAVGAAAAYLLRRR